MYLYSASVYKTAQLIKITDHQEIFERIKTEPFLFLTLPSQKQIDFIEKIAIPDARNLLGNINPKHGAQIIEAINLELGAKIFYDFYNRENIISSIVHLAKVIAITHLEKVIALLKEIPKVLPVTQFL